MFAINCGALSVSGYPSDPTLFNWSQSWHGCCKTATQFEHRLLDVFEDQAKKASSGVLCAAVMVAVDRSCGSAATELCELAGVELSTAPKRPAISKTMLTRMTWVPYGNSTHQCPHKVPYVQMLGAALRAALLPGLMAMEDRPAHLNQVSHSLF